MQYQNNHDAKLTVGSLTDALAREDDGTEVRIVTCEAFPQQLALAAITVIPLYKGIAVTEFDEVTTAMLDQARPVLWIATNRIHTRLRPPQEAWQAEAFGA